MPENISALRPKRFKLDAFLSILHYQRRFGTALDFSDMTPALAEEISDRSKCNCVIGRGDDLGHILFSVLLDITFTRDWTHQSNQVAEWITSHQVKWITRRMALNQQHQPGTSFQPIHQVERLIQSNVAWALTVDTIIRNEHGRYLRRKRIQPDDCIPPRGSLKVKLIGDYIGLTLDGVTYIYPLIVLSMLVSKSCELACLLYYISSTPRSDRHLIQELMLQYISICHEISVKYKNRAYTIFKSIDGLCQGILIKECDPSKNAFLFDNILMVLETDLLLCPLTRSLLHLLEALPKQDLLNFAGITKIFGHPSITPAKGVQKLYERTHHPIVILPEHIKNVINMSKFRFLDQYFEKHRKYPKVLFSHECPKTIVNSILRNEKLRNARHRDFDTVTLTPCVFFDEYERLYPLIKDKATSAPRDKVKAVLMGDTVTGSLSARALLDFVQNPRIFSDWADYMARFAKDPQLCLNQFVIKLTFKELEQKEEGRLFGASPTDERTRRVAMESNICSLMERYLPDQAMTLNDMEKRRRLYYLRRGAKLKPGFRQFIIAVDAKAWNNYFRADLVDAFGQDFLDPIFGTSYFRSTMRVFNEGLIYNVDQGRTARWWEGQDGGIEGLAQKVWTWVYCSIARLVIEEIGAEGHLMVNGDDMRMFLYIEEVKIATHPDFQGYLLNSMKTAFDRYGIQMKVDETVVTNDFVSFSRQAIINDCNIPSDWKKIMKCTGMSDTDMPIIASVTASIFSNAHSTAGQSYVSIPAYRTAAWMLSNYIFSYAPHLVPKTKNNFINLCVDLSIPSCLGGLEIILLPTILIQGESDPLPIALDWLRYLLESVPSTRLRITERLSLPGRSATEGIGQLLSNPYALPLSTAVHPMAVQKRFITAELPSITYNEDLRNLQRFDKSFREILVKTLVTMSPFNPRVASLLFSLSPCALIDSICAKFENSRTIAALFKRYKGNRLSQWARLTLQADQRYFLSRCGGRMEQTPLGQTCVQFLSNGGCATNLAERLREHLWQLGPLADVTQPSWVQQLRFSTKDRLLEDSNLIYTHSEEHFTAETAAVKSNDVYTGVLGQPPWSAFFEASTSMNLSHRFSLTGHYEPLVDSIKKITDAIAQLDGHGDDLAAWIDFMSISLFGEPISQFVPTVTTRVSGTITHRLRSKRFQEKIYLNLLPARSARCRIDLDSNMFTHRIDKENRKYNYLGFRVAIAWIASSQLESDVNATGGRDFLWIYLANCGNECSCHDAINETLITVEPPPKDLMNDLSSLMKTNVMLRLSSATLDALAEYRVEFTKRWGVSERTVEKIILSKEEAETCVIVHLLDRIKPGDIWAFEGNLRDICLMNQVVGRDLPLTGISCKDIVEVSPSLLFLNLIHYCSQLIHMKRSIPRLAEEAARMAVPKAFLYSLSLLFYQAGAVHVNELIDGLNVLLETMNQPKIRPSYTMLTDVRSLATTLLTSFETCLLYVFIHGVSQSYIIRIYHPTTPSSAFGVESAGTRVFMLISSLIKRSFLKVEPTGLILDEESVFTKSRDIRRRTIIARLTHILVSSLKLEPFVGGCSISEIPALPEQSIITAGRLIVFDPRLDQPAGIITVCEDEVEPWREVENEIRSVLKYRGFSTLKVVLHRITLDEGLRGLRHCKKLSSLEGTRTMPRIPIRPLRLHCDALAAHQYIFDFSGPCEDPATTTAQISEADVTKLMEELPQPPITVRPLMDTAFLFRPFRFCTTALNKYLEIIGSIQSIQTLHAMEMNILCVGDGSGGVSALMVRLFSNARVVFNTLIMDYQSRFDSAPCADQAFLNAADSLRLVQAHNAGGFNDLCDRKTVQYLDSVCGTENPLMILTCDAESKNIEVSPYDQDLLTNVVILACRSVAIGGFSIIKRYITAAGWNCSAIYVLKHCYESVVCLKPFSSNESSGEIFIVASNRQRTLGEVLIRKIIGMSISPPAEWHNFCFCMKKCYRQRQHNAYGSNALRNLAPVTALHGPKWNYPQETFRDLIPDPSFLIRWFEEVEVEVPRLQHCDDLLPALPQIISVFNLAYRDQISELQLFFHRSSPPMMKISRRSHELGAWIACSVLGQDRSIRDIEKLITDSLDKLSAPDEVAVMVRQEVLKGAKLAVRLFGCALELGQSTD